MSEASNKTKPTGASVADFIREAEPPRRREEAQILLRMFKDVSGLEPCMWGPSIIGFGSYHYRYESGREGEMCRAGFSPRKDKISIYLTGGYSNPATREKLASLRQRLGKHKTGASCLYINKLEDVDLGVLKEMIGVDLAYMDERYPR